MQSRQAKPMEENREEPKSEAADQGSGLRISRTTMPDEKAVPSAGSTKKEDHFLKILNQHSREICMVLNLEGRIKYCSQAIKSQLGYDAARLIGNNVKELIPVQQWVAFRAAMRASEEESDQPIIIDGGFIDIDDKRQNFSVSVVDHRHHPLIEGYIVHAHKISRVKRLEQKLGLRDLAIGTIKDAVVIIDPKRRKFVFANQAFYKLSGFARSEVVGGRIDLFKSPYSEMLFDQQTDAREIERFLKSIKNRRNYQGSIFSKKKNGEVFYNRLTLKPIIDHNNELQYYLVTSREMKKRK